jgi:hypothetical protein
VNDRDQGGRFLPGHRYVPRSQRPPRPATPCAWCGYPLAGRSDQVTCSPACRQALHRHRVTATAHYFGPGTPSLAADTARDPFASPGPVVDAVGAVP